MKLFYETEAPQIPLFLRLDARRHWRDVQDVLDLPKKEMAAVALALFDNGKAGHTTSYSRRHDQGGAGSCNGLMTRRIVVGCIDHLGDMGLAYNVSRPQSELRNNALRQRGV